MLARVARKLTGAALTVWAVVSLTFVLQHTLPSDPARVVAGQQARPADVARIRAQLGLDRPVAAQYAIFLRRLAHLSTRGGDQHASCAALGPFHVDLGMSYQRRRPVLEVVAERVPRTLALALAATLVQLAIGLAAGTLAAARKGRWVDTGIVAATLLGVSAPTFVTGLLLQWLLAYKLRLVPLDGFGGTTGSQVLAVILPALTLGLFGAAYATRLVRDEMIGLLRQDFVRTARAKGASELAVVVRHALRNALVPLVTAVGLDFGGLVGGAIVTEKLFRWPGLGQLSVDAVFDRDGPVVLGTVLVASASIVLANVLVDLSYAALDPRTRRP